MFTRLFTCLGVALLAVAVARPSLAQQLPAPQGAPSERRIAPAKRIAAAPVIDGVLDDSAWQDAPVINGFVQADPFEGMPASEDTEVRVVYDATAVYIGVRLLDRDPSQIVTTDTRRDSDLARQDSFQMVFDTFHDLQNGFVFGTNSAGIEYDAQIRNLGEPNADWDSSWEVRTHIGDGEWVAEFRVPLRTLRYAAPPQRWGVNFRRHMPRARETSYWSPLQRIWGINRLSAAGQLSGLELPAPRNLKILPYVVGSANRDFSQRRPTSTNGDWGLDAKVGVTPSLNLDLSYNTDFAQVEVDTQQINLSRANIRFPEKRGFFLENSGLFRVGLGNELDLFFTRRIGINESGGLVPVVGGGRLSGRVGSVNVGVLNMQTDSVGINPGNNFTTARLSQEFGNRSNLGAIFVNKQATGDLAPSDDWNRTFGVDGALGLGDQVTVNGFLARTQTPGLTGREHAYNVNFGFQDDRHRALVEYGVTGEDFNPEVGFLQRTGGYRRIRMGLWETLRQDKIRSWGFREFLPHAWFRRHDRLDGGGLDAAEVHIDYYWDWENGTFLSTGLMGSWEGFESPFLIYPGVIIPPGEHGGYRFETELYSDRRKPVFGRVMWDVGRFLTGNQNSPTFQVTLRKSGNFTLDTTWEHRNITLPQGNFRTNLGNMRVTYNFTPLIFVQSLLQYNDRTERFSTNLRFHWLDTAATGLFLVYNDTESMDGLGPVNRAFVVKYVRQFDLFN
ncbi:MAG: carbohydrate binding family 9 domain-containing protein [Acidobacteria bacterium]|nr:carbohydrate binding family 9 domain-containing protein [Acidobacteriota bacterium]